MFAFQNSSNCSIAFDSLETMVVDVGPPADWVKINVQRFVSFSLESLFRNNELIDTEFFFGSANI